MTPLAVDVPLPMLLSSAVASSKGESCHTPVNFVNLMPCIFAWATDPRGAALQLDDLEASFRSLFSSIATFATFDSVELTWTAV